jgi:hypothetical protein
MAKKKEENRGGARPGSGRPKVSKNEKAVPVSFSIKAKYKAEFKKIVLQIAKEFNERE